MITIISHRRRFLFTVFLISAALAVGQVHFTPVWTGNGVDHMNLYVIEASIEGNNMQAGDEIAVYDGTHCVGAAILSEEIIEGANFLSFVASKNDAAPPDINGYTVGNTVVVKLWDESEQLEISDVQVTYLSGSAVYSIGGTASFKVDGTPPAPDLPIADAGEDKLVNEAESVQLDGSASYDPLEADLTFAWSSPADITLDDSTLSQPGFMAPEVDEHTPFQFILTVNNGQMDSEPDTVMVTVMNINQPPAFSQFPSDTSIDRNATTVFEIRGEDPDPYDTLLFAVQFVPGISQHSITGIENGYIELALTPGDSDTEPITVTVSLTDQIISAPVEHSFTITLISTDVHDHKDSRAILITPGTAHGCFSVRNNVAEELYIEVIHMNGYILYSKQLKPYEVFHSDPGDVAPGIYLVRYKGTTVSGTCSYWLK